MGRTYVTDARDFTDALDPFLDIPAPARRMAEHIGRIVEVSTAWGAGHPRIETAIRCRRRPDHRACPGRLHVERTDLGEIRWRCPRCDDNGFISRWQHCAWDRSGLPLPGAEAVEVVLDEPEYRAVEAAHVMDPDAYAIVLRARTTPRGIVLTGDRDPMEELRDHVAGAANHERTRPRQRVLDLAYEAIAEALGWTA
jgi:hypothetical protein